jgi:L-iditol 2-dehydrogenase
MGYQFAGSFAEYVLLNKTVINYGPVHKVPDSMNWDEAALAEPLACATHGIGKLNIRLGQTVVVYGLGGIGLMMVQLAKASGAGKVIAIDVRDFSLEKAKQLGANYVINTLDKKSKYYAESVAAKVQEYNSGRKVPRCIVATSHMDALQGALLVTGACSTIVYFGLPSPEDQLKIPVLEAIQSERTINFSWLAPLVWDNVFAAVASGQVKVEPIITHKFSLAEAEAGIKFMKEGNEDKIKGIVVI